MKPPVSETGAQPKLAGVWKFERDFTNGTTFWSTVTVAPDGSYVCDATNFGNAHFKRLHMEGQWEIRDGMLIDTMTKYGNTNAQLLLISTSVIERFDAHELVLRDELVPSNYIESAFEKEVGN